MDPLVLVPGCGDVTEINDFFFTGVLPALSVDPTGLRLGRVRPPAARGQWSGDGELSGIGQAN